MWRFYLDHGRDRKHLVPGLKNTCLCFLSRLPTIVYRTIGGYLKCSVACCACVWFDSSYDHSKQQTAAEAEAGSECDAAHPGGVSFSSLFFFLALLQEQKSSIIPHSYYCVRLAPAEASYGGWVSGVP